GMPTAAYASGYAAWSPVNITSGFVSGVNTLDVYVTNALIWTGLRTELTNFFTCCCSNSIVLNCPSSVGGWVCGTNTIVQVNYQVTAYSRCSNAVSVVCIPPPGPFLLGTTWVTCIATDSLGNNTSCTFPVTVIKDITPPVVHCPKNIVRYI